VENEKLGAAFAPGENTIFAEAGRGRKSRRFRRYWQLLRHCGLARLDDGPQKPDSSSIKRPKS